MATRTERMVRWTARASAKATVGVGYAAIRGVYALGDAGGVFAEEFSKETARLTASHERALEKQRLMKQRMREMLNQQAAAAIATMPADIPTI